MQSIKDFRAKYPQYDDLTDQQLADLLYQSSYSDMPRSEFDKLIGVEPKRATGDKPPEALQPTGAGEFTGEQGSRYSETPRQPPRPQTLTPEDLAETNYGARAMGVEDLKLAINRAVGPGAKPQDMSALIRQSRVPENLPGPLGAVVRGATQNVLPTAGAIPTAGAGGALGALAGTALGGGTPLAAVTVPAGTLIGMVGGAVAGATGVNAAQDYLLQLLPETTLQTFGLSNLQRERDAERYPIARALGEGAPGFLAARPSAEKAEILAGGLASGGVELYRQARSGEEPSPLRIAAMAVEGALQGKPWGAGNVAFGAREGALDRSLRETAQPRGKPALSNVPFETTGDVGTLRVLGYEPTPLDVLPTPVTRRLVEGAAPTSDELGARFVEEGRKVRGPGETGTQKLGTRAVEPISEAPSYVTGEAVKGAEEAGLRVAGKGVTPEAELGPTTTAFAERVKADAAAAKARMDAAYEQARKNPAGATAVMSRDNGATIGNWRRMTPQERKYYRQRFDDQGIPYTEEGDYFIRDVPGGPPDVQPREALGPANVAEFNQSLREPLESFTDQPEAIQPLLKALSRFEAPKMSSLTSTDIFGLRKAVSDLITNNPGTTLQVAAGKVRQQIDRAVEQMYEAGRFTGDASAVGDMREAIGLARQYYRDYANEPTIAALVDADPGRARGLIFGSLTDKSPGAIANVNLVRQRVGDEAWEAIRKEAQAQVLGDDPAKTMAKWDKWSRENPRLRDILFTEQEQAAFPNAERMTRESTGVLSALKVGDTTLSAVPADFTAAVSGMSRKERWAAKTALRSNLQAALGKSDSAEAVLKSLSTDVNARQNLETLLGPEEAAALLRRAETLVRRSQRVGAAAREAEVSRGINVDPALAGAVEGATRGGRWWGLAVRFLEGRGMSRKEAEEITNDLLDPSKTDEVVAKVTRMYGETAAQALLRRVRAATSGSGLFGTAPRRLGVAAGVSEGQEEGKKPAEPTPMVAPQIDPDNVPSQEEQDRALLERSGVKLEAPKPEAPKPEGGGSAKTYSSVVPKATVEMAQSLSDDDLTALAIVAEASPNEKEMRAVGHVIANRVGRPKRFGNSVQDVLLDGEFDAFRNNPEELRALMRSDRFKRARELVQEIKSGRSKSPVGDYTHFLAPTLMRQKNYRTPSWASDPSKGIRIGQTVFFPGD